VLASSCELVRKLDRQNFISEYLAVRMATIRHRRRTSAAPERLRARTKVPTNGLAGLWLYGDAPTGTQRIALTLTRAVQRSVLHFRLLAIGVRHQLCDAVYNALCLVSVRERKEHEQEGDKKDRAGIR